MDKAVDLYITKQKSLQKSICLELRQIILYTFPTIEEKMKLGVPYYDDSFYIVALKDHVNLGFSIKGFSTEELKQFQGNGKTVRVMELYSKKDINKDKIVQLLKTINN